MRNLLLCESSTHLIRSTEEVDSIDIFISRVAIIQVESEYEVNSQLVWKGLFDKSLREKNRCTYSSKYYFSDHRNIFARIYRNVDPKRPSLCNNSRRYEDRNWWLVRCTGMLNEAAFIISR